MESEPTYGLDHLTAEQLLEKAQELSGAVGGAATFSRFFGPTDFIKLMEEHDRLLDLRGEVGVIAHVMPVGAEVVFGLTGERRRGYQEGVWRACFAIGQALHRYFPEIYDEPTP